MLAVLLSIAAEASFALGILLFNHVTDYGPNESFPNALWQTFHWPALAFTKVCETVIPVHHFLGDLMALTIYFAVGLLEWWIIFSLIIWLRRRSAKIDASTTRAQ